MGHYHLNCNNARRHKVVAHDKAIGIAGGRVSSVTRLLAIRLARYCCTGRHAWDWRCSIAQQESVRSGHRVLPSSRHVQNWPQGSSINIITGTGKAPPTVTISHHMALVSASQNVAQHCMSLVFNVFLRLTTGAVGSARRRAAGRLVTQAHRQSLLLAFQSPFTAHWAGSQQYWVGLKLPFIICYSPINSVTFT